MQLCKEGLQHGEAARTWDQRAAECIFHENNRPGCVESDEINLLGLFLREAEDAFACRLRADIAAGQHYLHAIVGEGLNATKLGAERLCIEMGLLCTPEENPERICIDLRGWFPPPPPTPPLPQQLQTQQQEQRQ